MSDTAVTRASIVELMKSELAIRRSLTSASPKPGRIDFNIEGALALISIAVAWQVASYFLPPFLFPPLEKIAATLADVLTHPESLGTIALTYGRVLLSLAAAFLAATALGVWAGINSRVDRTLLPLIQLKQGVPGVCWAIFAIIWFRDMETRIAFVVIVSTSPLFFFQAREGFRGISRDLWQMVRAWRPSRLQTLTKLIIPSMAPAMLVGWRLNLGNGARVTVTAELLAGLSGIGHHLRTAQEQFRMDEAMAWTAILAAFVLLTDYGMGRLEKRFLNWR